MARRRRRRRRGVNPTLLFALVAILLVYAVSVSVWRATHGLIVYVVLLAIIGAIGYRIHRRRSIRAYRLRVATDLYRLQTLDPREFEDVMATVLGSNGWKLRVNGGAGDEGADLIGTDPQGRPAIVQCKRYNANSIGSPVIQLMIGARAIHRAERVLVVTTSYFTAPARKLAAREGIELIDGEEVANMAAFALDAAPHPEAGAGAE